MARFSVSVPATTANLGPGYDSFGLALELRNEFHAERADAWAVEMEGAGTEELPADETNLVVVAMKAVFERAGRSDLKATIQCVNYVPLGSGLGSSSTALVGGGVLGRKIVREIDPDFVLYDDELLDILSKIEGHPDNIAPALLGGFTICYENDDTSDMICCERFHLNCPIAAIVVPSTGSLATKYARGLVPVEVSHKDAVFNLSHASLLAAALIARRPDLLSAAIDDKIHQPYRLKAVEDYEAVAEILRKAGVDAVALSGAGPTIIAFVSGLGVREAILKARDIAQSVSSDIVALGTRLEPLALRFSDAGEISTLDVLLRTSFGDR